MHPDACSTRDGLRESLDRRGSGSVDRGSGGLSPEPHRDDRLQNLQNHVRTRRPVSTALEVVPCTGKFRVAVERILGDREKEETETRRVDTCSQKAQQHNKRTSSFTAVLTAQEPVSVLQIFACCGLGARYDFEAGA